MCSVSELTTDEKGNIAEQAIALAASRLRVQVLRPIGEGSRYDLGFVIGCKLIRVQCKWSPLREGCVMVRCRRARRAREGLRAAGYTTDEIDAYAAYCPSLDRCYFLPIGQFDGQRAVQLRVSPARNAQRGAILLASDYEFGQVDWHALGAVAQMERASGWQPEGRGFESPQLHSSSIPEAVGAHIFRNHFGWYMQQAAAGHTFEVSRRGRPFARLGPPGSAAP